MIFLTQLTLKLTNVIKRYFAECIEQFLFKNQLFTE